MKLCQSDMPSRDKFTHSFDRIADVIDGFTSAMALKHPEKIAGIISQNGNAYSESLGQKWKARAQYWKNPTPETIICQYTFGTKPGSVSPDGYTLDIHYTQRPGYDKIHFVDSGHFALEACCEETAGIIRKFLL